MSTASCAAARCGSTAAGSMRPTAAGRRPGAPAAGSHGRNRSPPNARLRGAAFQPTSFRGRVAARPRQARGSGGPRRQRYQPRRGRVAAARRPPPFLELVHRLDRDTSGVLLLAKKRGALTAMHGQLREGRVQKFYLVLVKGAWQDESRNVQLPLQKFVTGVGRTTRERQPGRPVVPHPVPACRRFQDFSLLEAELKTGRTHQIRVHLAHLGTRSPGTTSTVISRSTGSSRSAG